MSSAPSLPEPPANIDAAQLRVLGAHISPFLDRPFNFDSFSDLEALEAWANHALWEKLPSLRNKKMLVLRRVANRFFFLLADCEPIADLDELDVLAAKTPRGIVGLVMQEIGRL